MGRLSATTLAAHHHFDCDLYLHNAYYGQIEALRTGNESQSELTRAILLRGIHWEEARLFPFLDKKNLLLTIPSIPVDANMLFANIEADDRDYFFIAGVTLLPPPQLKQRFLDAGKAAVEFAIAKPDLLEITRSTTGVTWKVVDAKASKYVKTSHHAQIYFYTLCLSYLLPQPYFQPSGTAAIWLPPAEVNEQPSIDDIKDVKISLLASSLDNFLFNRLPDILSVSNKSIPWHLNPLCRGCPFEDGCKKRTIANGELGNMANISLAEVETMKEILRIFRGGEHHTVSHATTDIEDLHFLISDKNKLAHIQKSCPVTVRKLKRKLAISIGSSGISPILEAVRTKTIQIIPHYNFTCPRTEDIAVVVSLIIDPASVIGRIIAFGISIFSSVASFQSRSTHGSGTEFVTVLASIFRGILALHKDVEPTPLTQVYVFSPKEQSALQTHLTQEALTASLTPEDIRLCIGALGQGTSFLQTTFHPLLMSGALLDFITTGQLTETELQTYLERMGLPTSGHPHQLQSRVEDAIRQLKAEGCRISGHSRTQVGQLGRVVVLAKELEALLALPIPGYWNLPECASILLPPSTVHDKCPSDEDLFSVFTNNGQIENTFVLRNYYIFAVLDNLRKRISSSGTQLLVNDATTLTCKFADICKDENLGKLFFMQQFEVLAKLTELWNARIHRCPDAPVLEYLETVHENEDANHLFRLVSGALDTPNENQRKSFYDYIMTEDRSEENRESHELPIEALYDDLGSCDLRFPLTRYNEAKWETQHPEVQDKLIVADICGITSNDTQTVATLRTWGGWKLQLSPGQHYRLSPRFVDFNITKILSTLLEVDIKATNNDHIPVPFLQLLADHNSFNHHPAFIETGPLFINEENKIQTQLQELKNQDKMAEALALQPSQHRAVHHVLANRLSVLWGPPGTGKTHTVSLALLRLLEVQHRLHITNRQIVFITATTHGAIQAILDKLRYLRHCYNSIQCLHTEWLQNVHIEHVSNGNSHSGPSLGTHIYAGTVYQLYTLSKRHAFQVDCVIFDEAGQLGLTLAALVLRSLGPAGRIVITGDSEQLAPILTAKYPQLKSRQLFGSMLNYIMHAYASQQPPVRINQLNYERPILQEHSSLSAFRDTVIQLTENFRLNPDLCVFVSTIYSAPFKSHKVQTGQLAAQLKSIQHHVEKNLGIEPQLLLSARSLLLALSAVMLGTPQTLLRPPTQRNASATLRDTLTSCLTPTPTSMALVRLHTRTARHEGVIYEAHVRGEAALAAALVSLIRKCSPEENIFVATPYKIQRQAVKSALQRTEAAIGGNVTHNVVVDTIERLQGSEATFVICLFSLPHTRNSSLGFLLDRRRLNVAISRAKMLCILITSLEVLRPPINVLTEEGNAKGCAFLRGFEDHAWSCDMKIDLDKY